MSDPQPTGGRRKARFKAGLVAELHDGGSSFRCTAENLSRTGVLLAGELPRPGKRVELTLRASIGDLSLRLVGTAARVEPNPEGDGIRLGVQFDPLDDEQRDTLDALIARLLEGRALAQLEKLPPTATVKEIRAALEKIPLPHRISLAARANPREREYLIHDMHPQVLESLVRNPGLLRAEVHALASRRELLPTTIELMAREERWQADAELKIILATHGQVPLPLSERLLSGLRTADLRKALQRPGLNDAMRAKILRRIARS